MIWNLLNLLSALNLFVCLSLYKLSLLHNLFLTFAINLLSLLTLGVGVYDTVCGPISYPESLCGPQWHEIGRSSTNCCSSYSRWIILGTFSIPFLINFDWGLQLASQFSFIICLYFLLCVLIIRSNTC